MSQHSLKQTSHLLQYDMHFDPAYSFPMLVSSHRHEIFVGPMSPVHSTGLLEFTKLLAVVFALGVCSGISTWFFLLLSLLKKYKQVYSPGNPNSYEKNVWLNVCILVCVGAAMRTYDRVNSYPYVRICVCRFVSSRTCREDCGYVVGTHIRLYLYLNADHASSNFPFLQPNPRRG